MLNRHTLRIKALQTLYAIRQAENANYQLALDALRADFAPDLNAMIRPDAQRLEGLRQLATLTFEELAGQKTSDEDVPAEARRAAAGAFASYREANRADRQRLVKAALSEPSRIYDHYLLVLLLLLELADEATLADERRQSADPDVLLTTPFGRNATLAALRGLTSLHTEAIRRNLAWTDDDRRSRIRPFFPGKPPHRSGVYRLLPAQKPQPRRRPGTGFAPSENGDFQGRYLARLLRGA